ncbi:hypothetical protein MMC26_006896 [Xylographa opegraphella]|nr:hypothetical protein [Xylographa opegraphella]
MPLLTLIKDLLRDARDEYLEHIAARQARDAAQSPTQKQADTQTALTAQNLERLPKAGTDPSPEREAKDEHKRRRRHRSRNRKPNHHEDPDNRDRRKHTNPDHGRTRHRKHKTTHPPSDTDPHHLVSRLVRRLEKGVQDESSQVEYLQDAAQRLLHLADEKGRRAGSAVSPGRGAAEESGETSNGVVATVAGELVQLVGRAATAHGGQGKAGRARGAVEMAGGLLESVGERRSHRGESARSAGGGDGEGGLGGREGKEEEEGRRGSSRSRDGGIGGQGRERGESGESVSTLGSEENE